MSEESNQHSGPVTKDKLIEAAGEIFAEKGLYGARVRDITDKAGANVSAVNYYFHDKFELYTQVLLQAHMATTEPLMRPLESCSPEEQIRIFIKRVLDSSFDPERPKWHLQLLARELVQPTPAMDQVQKDLKNPSHQLRDAIQRMKPHLSKKDASFASSSIVALMIFYTHHRHLLNRMFPDAGVNSSIEEIIEHIIQFSLSSLRGLQSDQSEE